MSQASPDEPASPREPVDDILRKARFGVRLLSIVFAALAVWGLVRFPHWLWSMSIVAAAVALIADHRLRNARSRGETVLLGVGTLLFVVLSGVLLGVTLQLARS